MIIKEKIRTYEEKAKNFVNERPFLNKLASSLKRFLKADYGKSAAASSYYFLFSLFPLIILLFSIVAKIEPNLESKIEQSIPELSMVVPEQIIQTLMDFIKSASTKSSASIISVTALGLLWSAMSGVGNIVNGLNNIYREKTGGNFLIQKLFGFLGVLVISLLLVFVLLAMSFNQFILDQLKKFITLPDILVDDQFNILTYLVAFVILSFVFFAIYHILSRAKAKIRHTFIASSFTAIGWLAISFFLQIYLNQGDSFQTKYGSIAGIIILMLWMYAAIYLIMIGAFVHKELMRYSQNRGKKAKVRRLRPIKVSKDL